MKGHDVSSFRPYRLSSFDVWKSWCQSLCRKIITLQPGDLMPETCSTYNNEATTSTSHSCSDASYLLDHSLPLADLGTETRLDRRHGPSRSARVARDEVQSVLAFVELGVGAAARFAGDVFHYNIPFVSA